MRSPPALIIALALLGAGCASAPRQVESPEVSAPLVEPLPLRIGVRVAGPVRSYVYDDPLTGVGYRQGEPMTRAFLAACRASFAEVVELPDDASAPYAGLDGVVELATLELDRKPVSTSHEMTARLEVTLSDASGAPAGSWSATQVVSDEEVTGDPGEPLKRRISVYESHPSLLIEKSAAAFLREFRDVPEIRPWLEARGAYRPPFPAAAAEASSPPRRGIHVTSDVASDSMRRCVLDRLVHDVPGRHFLLGPAVRRALYPWLSDRPSTDVAIERLTALVHSPAAQARFDALGLGTMVFVTGATSQELHGGGACGAGSGGGGCLGLYWGDRNSVLAARVFDIAKFQAVASSQASRSGAVLVPMFLLPLPFIPATQTAACDEVSKAVAKALQE